MTITIIRDRSVEGRKRNKNTSTPVNSSSGPITLRSTHGALDLYCSTVRRPIHILGVTSQVLICIGRHHQLQQPCSTSNNSTRVYCHALADAPLPCLPHFHMMSTGDYQDAIRWLQILGQNMISLRSWCTQKIPALLRVQGSWLPYSTCLLQASLQIA